MAHQVAVIGMGRFGISLARELYQIGHDVLAIDRDESLSQQMMGHVTYTVTGDSTSSELLEEVGIRHFDTAVVAIGTDIQSSVLTTVLLKQFGLGQVIARATNELHGKTLKAVGADRVVYPEQETGLRTAHSLFQREVLEYMELTSEFGFSKINVPPEMAGLTLEQAGFGSVRDKYGAAVIAIRRGREPILSPSKDETMQEGDQLVLAGPEDALERISRR
ncbi:MAG: TrkA family potassium uptake protein [Chloroflexi bacterium]|nr:TrkA family potassium uptake protein [Chloroflexota bacterium]MCH7656160.1 TrkA family potassium uptake protein [Chloroflexota bacterium]